MKTWSKKEYEQFLPQLELLNRGQLANLAKNAGVSFDEPQKVTKKEYLLALDETNPDMLKKEFNKIAKGLTTSKTRTKKSKNSDIEKTGQSPITPGYGNNP